MNALWVQSFTFCDTRYKGLLNLREFVWVKTEGDGLATAECVGYRKTIKADQTTTKTTRKQKKSQSFSFSSHISIGAISRSRKCMPFGWWVSKNVTGKIETWPDKADMGYQIIGICRNLRLDYFSVFALLDYVAGQFRPNQPIRVPFILRIFESPL